MDLAGLENMLFLALTARLLFVKAMIFVGDMLEEVFPLKSWCFSYEDPKLIYGLVMSLK